MNPQISLRFLLATLILLSFLVPARTVQAASVPCDAGALIAAINAANASAGDDVIDLQAGCTYILTHSDNTVSGANGLPVIQPNTGRLTINGNGATITSGSSIWIPFVTRPGQTSAPALAPILPQSANPSPSAASGSRTFRILLVLDGADLTLKNMVLQGGNLPDQNGGAILNEGTLTILSSILRNNIADAGGAIFNTGDLNLNDTTLSANIAGSSGGGINSSGTLTIEKVTFSHNSAPQGDGLQIANGSVTVHLDLILIDDSRYDCPTFPYTVPAGDTTKLVEAIRCANSDPVGDVINLAAGSTYTLTGVDNNGGGSGPTGLPIVRDTAVSGALTVNGNNATIQRSSAAGMPDFRIWVVELGGFLMLNQMTIRNGALPVGNVGGAIHIRDGDLTLTNVVIDGNRADYGGGIAGSGTKVTITGSTISNNKSVHDGAGANIDADLTIDGSTFIGNEATGLGGGLLFNGTIAHLTNTTFAKNKSQAMASGAGLMVFNLSGQTVADISGCTFTENAGYGSGGAIFTTLRTVTTLTNSTLTGNSAGWGGGIVNNGVLTVAHSTIVANQAVGGSGGIAISQGTVNLYSTIVALNSGPNPDLEGSFNSQGYNLIGSLVSAKLNGVTDGNLLGVTDAQLNLGALQSNGGPTQTMALLTNSVAINAGDPAFTSPSITDQRGLPRVAGGRIDIGAYESQ